MTNIGINVVDLLHQRIIDKCFPLFLDEHFPQAAYEALKQIELALKEKGDLHCYGKRMIENVFGEGRGLKLFVPFGKDLQKQANEYFKGTFAYYRNTLAHKDVKIDKVACSRIMVLASDLLDLIGASSIYFEGMGPVEGLIKHSIFRDEEQLSKLLYFLTSQTMFDDTFDGFFEDLYSKGFVDRQCEAVIHLYLVEYKETAVFDDPWTSKVGKFEITSEGEAVLKMIEDSEETQSRDR